MCFESIQPRPHRPSSSPGVGRRLGRAPRRATGFTLTELMVAVALVLVIMLGVNYVFKMTTDTIGAGMAVSAVTRDQKAARRVIETDVAGLSPTSPALVIWGKATAGYLDRAAIDADPGLADPEYFRTDRLGYFSEGTFVRQTANNGSLYSPLTSEKAYIWFGHLLLPDNSATPLYIIPGAGTQQTNPNNFFARQWAMGRVVTLLKQKTSPSTAYPTPSIYSSGTTAGTFVDQSYIEDPGPGSPFPVAYNAPAHIADGTPAPVQIQNARYDLAGFDDADIWAAVTTKLGLSATWWDATGLGFRFECDPYPSRPLTSAGAAKSSPQFLPGCTDFVVEFAGDYLIQLWDVNVNGTPDEAVGDADQPTYGQVTGVGQDGRIDMPRVNGVMRIAWYGFPRDANGDGVLKYGDPAPVRWYANAAPAVFEREALDAQPPGFASAAGVNFKTYAATANPYVTAWTDAQAADLWPKLIRITYTLQDPSGRINNPQPVELIFAVN
jgi:prepilin-type N-terminal cleavage/methylation domain-containing protein